MTDEMTIAEFCDAHRACDEGRQWALTHCQTMRDVWRDASPEWLLWVATRPGVLTDRELRLFRAAALDAAWDAVWDAQAAWLRENTLPDFARRICVAVEGTR